MTAWKGKRGGMVWGYMVQLGHNMWEEAPLYGASQWW